VAEDDGGIKWRVALCEPDGSPAPGWPRSMRGRASGAGWQGDN
jgi:hypothetical protein